jgi:GNAT superfamily N-acetyltransferase
MQLPEEFEFKPVPFDFNEAYVDLLCLRQAVLRTPLGLTFAMETLKSEANQQHIGLYQKGNPTAIGCYLIKVEADGGFQMRQVAVHPAFQGQGLGKQLVAHFEEYAKQQGANYCYIHGRTTVIPFYEQLGYTIVGDSFFLPESGLDHYRLEKNIAL